MLLAWEKGCPLGQGPLCTSPDELWALHRRRWWARSAQATLESKKVFNGGRCRRWAYRRTMEFVFLQLTLGAEAGPQVGIQPGVPGMPLLLSHGRSLGVVVECLAIPVSCGPSSVSSCSSWGGPSSVGSLSSWGAKPCQWIASTLPVLFIISVHALVFFPWCSYMFSLFFHVVYHLLASHRLLRVHRPCISRQVCTT